MSITDDIKRRLCEEVKFDDDGYSAMCRVIDEFAEALKPSHNTLMDEIAAEMDSVANNSICINHDSRNWIRQWVRRLRHT
jgi:hypothetical protein